MHNAHRACDRVLDINYNGTIFYSDNIKYVCVCVHKHQQQEERAFMAEHCII